MKTILTNRKINWIAGFTMIILVTADVGLAQHYSRRGRENAGQPSRQENARQTVRSNEASSPRIRYQARTQNTAHNEYNYKNYGQKNASEHANKWKSNKKWHKEPYHYSYHRIPNWTYNYHPVAFRHDHGQFYFHEDRFYRYHEHYGYIIVENPYEVVFTTMPYGYRRIIVDGVVYYKYGNLFFSYTPYGYQLIPRKHWIYLSARF